MSTSESSVLSFGIAVVLCSSLAAGVREQEPAVVVSVLPLTRAALYSSVAPETYLFFADMPLRFELTLTATGGADLRLRNPDGFARGLRRRLSHVEGTVRREIPADLVLENARTGRSRNDRLSRVLSVRTSGPRLSPGSYRLNVEFDDAELAPSQKSPSTVLRREVRFEVKEPSTLREDLDHLLHQSYQSNLDADVAGARAFAEQAVKLHAQSLPAIVDIADAWQKEGNCGTAAQYWKQAIQILMTNGDSLLAQPIESPRELRISWEARMTQCAP